MKTQQTWTLSKTAALGALYAMAALPVAASADPPAVGAPTIPPVVVGAPTNDNPNAGQFSVDFDSTGAYQGIGTAPEPALTRDLTPQTERRQARAVEPRAQERASVNHLFANLAQQLRDQAAPQAAALDTR